MNSLSSSCIVLLAIFAGTVTAQICPSHWYGYNQQSKCYRFVSVTRNSWQQAREFCTIHGGDILRIDTAAEKTWLMTEINKINQRNHMNVSWWSGLTAQGFSTQWSWADGTAPGGFISWVRNAPHAPTSGLQRCAKISRGKFNDDSCSNRLPFVCYRDRGLPMNCDADNGWQSLNGACYKVRTDKRNWQGAVNACNHDGATLTTIDSRDEEVAMRTFASNNRQPIWIGLRAQPSTPNTAVNWTWVNGTTPSTFYWHGQPSLPAGKCVSISNSFPATHDWVVTNCNQARSFVCRKPEGVCMPGWIGHRGNCYQFNVHYHVGFGAARQFCQDEGAHLVKIDSWSTQAFINSYMHLMRDSGGWHVWIGLSDNNRTNVWSWRDGSVLGQGHTKYTNWDPVSHAPVNTPLRQDCAWIAGNDASGKWHTTSACQSPWTFICQIPAGRPVSTPKSTPRPHYACPPNSGWKQRGPNCFKVMTATQDWSTARQTCKQTPGGDLAKINNADLQSWVNGLTQIAQQYWIGLNDRSVDGKYTWASDLSVLGNGGYSNWKPNEPNNHNHQQNCVALDRYQWNDFECNQKKKFICEMVADSIFPSTPPTTPPTDWTAKCGPGWVSNPLSDYCYMFIDEPLTWLDALNECGVYHGNLLAIESSIEQNFIAGQISSMSSVGLWIGANDKSSEGGWRWTAGRPFAFLNWAPGQPNVGAAGNGTDCVVMLTANALWDDVDCNTRNGYVCEKRGAVKRTPAPQTTTVRVPNGMVLGCQQGWLPFRSYCYKIIMSPSTWNDAQFKCGKNGAKLASILDRNENNFLQGNLPRPKLSWDGVWLGLNDIQVDNTFQWADGSAVTFTYWNNYEPNNWGNRNEDCVEMRLNNAKWNDEVCSLVRPGFVCKAPKSPRSATQAPYQVGCMIGAQGHGPYCYRVVNWGQPLAFDAANTFCKRNWNGSLAVINDGITQAFVAANMVWMNGYFWIGLSDEASAGTYKWVTGETIRYTNWYSTHTGNEQSTCVAMRADTPTGLWENLPCSQTKHFVCQMPRKGYTIPPITTPYPNVPCPTGWVTNTDHCLKGFSQKLTWTEALGYCQGIGGDLASFHQNEKDAVLQQLQSSIQGGSVWIGLNDRQSENGHVWSDGSPVDYTNWNGGEPNDFKQAEDCVQYLYSARKWNDVSCSYSQPFVCSVPRGTNVPTSVPAPTAIAHASQCGDDQAWFMYKGQCYRFSDLSGDNSSLTWYSAQSYCNSIGANLASVHSQDENDMLFGTFSKRGQPLVWIGLNDLDGTFKWADKTPLDYSFYSPGEPNDYFGAEKCVGMVNYGQWNDLHCSRPRGYICKKPVNGAARIPSPTPYPQGGCANGFQRAPGGRNKCFYLGGRQPSLRLNWTAAYQFCRRFGKGYDIASIEDVFEQQYVISMTAGWRNSYWIGLNDRLTNNKFFWQDQTPVFYTNWDSGEPTSQNSQGNQKNVQNCVLMRMYKGHEGRWADVDCSQPMGYICQAVQDPNLPLMTTPSSCAKSGYWPFRQSCYKASAPSDKKTWSAAQSTCQADGGNLVSISDIYESAYVGNLVHRRASYWIGLSDTKVHGLYGWVDGWPVTYTNWGWREPSYGQTGTGCVAANPNSRWNDTACSTPLQYVCEISGAPPPTTPATIGKCANPTWVANGDFCYAVFVNQGRSWPDANYLCQKAGMQLVSIHSQAEMSFVQSLVSQTKLSDPTFTPNIWIGLNQGGQGSFQWSDGSQVNFASWARGQPTKLVSNGMAEECVEFDRKTGKWDDLACFAQNGYVCKTYKVLSTPPPQQVINQGGVSNNLPHNDNLNTYSVTQGVVGGVTGSGQTQLPSITRQNVYSSGGKSQAQSGDVKTSSTNLGLSNGGIAGVVIACVIVIALVGVGLVFLKRRGVVKSPNFNENMPSTGFDNAMYDKHSDKITLDSETDA